MSERLSEHFALSEFVVSAARPDLLEPPPPAAVHKLRRLALTVLEPIRVAHGKPMRVLSGFRPEKLNAAIGGSPTSQHRYGEASDFTTDGLAALFRKLLGRQIDVPCGQCIWYPDRAFVHIALPSGKYPRPSFHVQYPSKGLKYDKVRSPADLDALFKAAGVSL